MTSHIIIRTGEKSDRARLPGPLRHNNAWRHDATAMGVSALSFSASAVDAVSGSATIELNWTMTSVRSFDQDDLGGLGDPGR
ncbi:hypothetical protein [Streptomyces sp. HF10]|uniref:hypothetical protein n=1 Tax=Streptomyces sp. HF10 TaxID=2692233 RepID=UPI001315C16E|nr:hypothetical protein [Streptomyces sp. HF10]QHC31889.1 hypothetical protein GR129_26955 [Streptomyces sp. HF10]